MRTVLKYAVTVVGPKIRGLKFNANEA